MAVDKEFLFGNPPSFEQFVNNGPISILRASRLSATHFNTQTSFLFDEDWCPMVDFIGKLETFESDFLHILKVLDVPELWRGYEKYGVKGHVGNDPNLFGTHYKRRNPIVFTEEMEKKLLTREAADFEYFGYTFPKQTTQMHAESIWSFEMKSLHENRDLARERRLMRTHLTRREYFHQRR